MSIFIEDGVGRGYKAGITEENQILTQAEIHELQHHISWGTGQAYQVWGNRQYCGYVTIAQLRNSSYLICDYK
jgi:hypothetical protein